MDEKCLIYYARILEHLSQQCVNHGRYDKIGMHPNILMDRALVYESMGEYDKALEDISKSIECYKPGKSRYKSIHDKSKLDEAYFRRGCLYEKCNKLVPALKDYSKCECYDGRKRVLNKLKCKIFQKNVSRW